MSDSFAEVARDSARGSFTLILGQIITHLLSATSVIFIARFLGSFSLGEITIVMVPINIAILLNDFGVNNALTKYIAQYRYENKKDRIWKLFEAGLIFNTVSIIISTLILYLYANTISEVFLHRPDLSPLIRIASLYIVGNGLLTMAQAVLVGYDMMGMRGLSQIIWALIKSFAPPILVYLGYGPYGAVLGNVIAVVVSGGLGLLVVYFIARKEFRGSNTELISSLKQLLIYGFPLYLGSIANGGLHQFYSVLMTLYVSLDKIGNYNASANFGVLVTLFTVPISTALFPLFSKMNNRKEALGPFFERAVKYTSLLTIPITFALILFSDSVVKIIYPVGFIYTALFLKLHLVMFLFQGIGGLTVGSLLNGTGETHVTFKMHLVTTLFGIPLGLWLIPQYEIIGMLIAMIIAPRAGLIYGLYWIKKNLNIGFDMKSSLSIYTSAITATIVCYIIIYLFQLNSVYTLLITSPIFFLTYCILILLTGGLTKKDLNELSSISNVKGPLAPLIIKLLKIVSNLARY